MPLRLLRTYLRPYRTWVVLTITLQITQTLALLMLPTLSAQVIDRGLLVGSLPGILWLGTGMLLVVVVQLAARLGAEYFAARAATAVGRDLRSAMFRHVQRFSAHDVGRFGTSSLATRTLNDVQQVQTLAADGLSSIITAPIMCVVSVVLALRQDVPLALVVIVLIPVTTVVVAVILTRMGRLYDRIQGGMDTIGRLLREQITGVRVIRASYATRTSRSGSARPTPRCSC